MEEAVAECESRPNRATTAASARELDGAQQVRHQAQPFICGKLLVFIFLVVHFSGVALCFDFRYLLCCRPAYRHTHTRAYTSTHVVCNSFCCHSYCCCRGPQGITPCAWLKLIWKVLLARGMFYMCVYVALWCR